MAAVVVVRVGCPKQVVGHARAEFAMDTQDEVSRIGRVGSMAVVDQALHFDVRHGFELEVALLRIGSVGASQRTVDIDRVSVVALNQVGIVAVHRANQVADGRPQRRMKPGCQCAGLGNQLGCGVFQPMLPVFRQ